MDVAMQDMALKAQWIMRVYKNNAMLTVLAYYFLNTQIKNSLFWECNIAPHDIKFFEIQHKFWEDVLTVWCTINYNKPSDQEIQYQIIWYNSYIK